jgi:hypothetical protein
VAEEEGARVSLETKGREATRGPPKRVGDGLQSFMVVFGYTAFLRSMDWLTTGLAFIVGLSEGNPLQARLIELGAGYYFAFQWLGIFAMALLMWTASQRMGLWKALLLETGILLYPVIHNVTMIVVSSFLAR